jgi:hypothetical protein
MENFQEQVKQTVKILKKAYEDIELILEDENLTPWRNKLLRVLDREVTALSTQHNLEYQAKYSVPFESEPLLKVMGRDVRHVKKEDVPKQLLNDEPVQKSSVGQTAKEVEANEIREKANDLMLQFVDIEPEALLDQYEEIVIRAVGKLAGLPVTDLHPKNVNAQFIAEIKDAILLKNKVDEEVNVGSEAADKFKQEEAAAKLKGESQKGNSGKPAATK